MAEGTHRDISNIEEQYSEGELFRAWTNRWGLKVYPWYNMDLVKFSFIEKGKDGKGNSFNISIPAKKNYAFDFTDMCHEILQDIKTPFDFFEILKKEKEAGEQYPKRYKFISGSEGEKMLGFCNSKTEGMYCINASTMKDGKKVVVTMPLSYYDIYEIATVFSETYQERREELKQILKKGIANTERRYKQAQATKSIEALEVTSTAQLERQQNGDYLLDAVTKAGDKIIIRITQRAIDQMNAAHKDCFEQFQKRTAEHETVFTFSGKISGTEKAEYMFEQFVTQTKKQS